MNFLKKLFLLFFKPTQFYEAVSEEKSYIHIFSFYAIFAIIIAVLVQIPWEFFQYADFMFQLILSTGFIFSLIKVLFFPFVYAFLIYFIIIRLGGKSNYLNTYKVAAYAGIIGLVYGLIFSFVVNNGAINDLIKASPSHNLTFAWATLPVYLIILAEYIQVFYSMITGLSIYQKIRKVPILIVLIVLEILFYLMGYLANFFGFVNIF